MAVGMGILDFVLFGNARKARSNRRIADGARRLADFATFGRKGASGSKALPTRIPSRRDRRGTRFFGNGAFPRPKPCRPNRHRVILVCMIS